ncbi:MAG: oligosaccharide flippase family protein [Chitinophagales bacterium]|nr:oligosaccharide flippase family protein [Chitinophagales bacterium]
MGIVQRQSIQSSIITYAGAFIGAVNIFLFPKFLTTDQFGLTRVLISVAVILSQLSMLGISFTILRFIPYFNDKKNQHHGFFSFALRIALLGFVIASLLFLVFKNPVQNFFREKSSLFVEHYFCLFPLAFLMVLFELFFFYSRSLLKTVVPIAIREVVLRMLQTAALLCYIFKWVSFDGFIILFIGSYLLHLIAIVFYVGFLKQLFVFSKINFEQKPQVRQLMRYSLFVFAASIAAVYTSNIDVIMLSGLAGLTSTGVYSIAFFVGTLIQIPGRTMNQVAIPIVADAWKRDDKLKLQQLYSQTALNQLLIGGFIFLIIWINTDLLLSFLPATYQGAKWAILIVGIGKLFDLATGINGEIILYSKHVKVNLITNLFLIIIATISNYLLIPLYGVEGSAAAVAISLFCYNMIRMIFLYYQYKLQPFGVNTLKALVLLTACLIIYLLLPSTKNIWIDGIYQTLVPSIFFIFFLLYFKISPEIEVAFNDSVKILKRKNSVQ